MWASLLYKELSLEGNIEIAESCPFPLKYLKYDNKRGDLKGKNVMTDILP